MVILGITVYFRDSFGLESGGEGEWSLTLSVLKEEILEGRREFSWDGPFGERKTGLRKEHYELSQCIKSKLL